MAKARDIDVWKNLHGILKQRWPRAKARDIDG